MTFFIAPSLYTYIIGMYNKKYNQTFLYPINFLSTLDRLLVTKLLQN